MVNLPTAQRPHVPTLVVAIVAAVVLIGLYHLAKKKG